MSVNDVSKYDGLFVVLSVCAASGFAQETTSLERAQRCVFRDQTACVCGHSPDPQSRNGLKLDDWYRENPSRFNIPAE